MKPKLAITMGDPAGIGPEIIIKALADGEIYNIADCVVIGNASVLEKALEFPNMPRVRVNRISSPDSGEYSKGIINVIVPHTDSISVNNIDSLDVSTLKMGEVNAICGAASYRYIEMSVKLALEGIVDSVVTAPINKESLHAANVPYIGHTEIFGALTCTENPITMFETCGLRIFFLTRHVSLKAACDFVTKERIIECAERCIAALRELHVTGGTMAIAGLNPHCGEHGLFGNEESTEIAPAVAELQSRGYDVAGPVGADSVFYQARMGKYSSVLSLYHDQGHIAAKTLDFERTISFTLGMPILRTSVDHGTAFDIAGTGMASDVSIREAIRLAAKYTAARKYTNDK